MQAKSLDQLLSPIELDRLRAFKRDVSEALPGAVQEVILFGSRARGDAQNDSDYDLAVVLSDSLANDFKVRHQVYDVSYDYIVDGYDFQPVAMNAADFRPTRSELAMRVAAEGLPI